MSCKEVSEMKRWIHASSYHNKKIVITINIEEAEGSIAASEYLSHPKNIKKRNRISDQHLEYINDIIATFDHNIQAAGFPITSRRPAKNSYSYYLTFVPVSEEGEELLPVDLIFRVSSHTSKTAEDSTRSSFARIISFTLGHEDYNKASDLIYKGIYILKELKKGNIDVLDEL